MLIVPRKRIWTQQPQGAAQVDWSNPITRGLVYCGNSATTSGGKAACISGVSFSANQVAYQPGITIGANIPATEGLTLLSVGLINYANDGSNNNFGIRIGVLNNYRFLVGVAGYSSKLQAYAKIQYADYSVSTTTFSNHGAGNRQLVLAATYERNQAAGLKCFANNVIIGSVATSDKNIFSESSPLVINSADGGSNNLIFPTLLNLYWSRSLSAEEIASLSANPWQIFRAPDSRIFVPTGAGAAVGAVLTGNAQAQATATGNLTLKADLDAVALSVATASGNLTTFIPLTGAAVAIGSASGALTSGIKLSAAATASALVSGSLVAQIKLNGAALAQAAASAGLTSAILLAGSGQGQATASGTLAADPGSMAGNAQAQATAVATLTTSIRLSGAAAAQAGVSGILTTNISLTAAALAQAIATGTLAVPILLAGTAHGVATASGNLTAPDSATAVYFRLASSVQRLTKAACTAQRLTTIKHEVQHV